MMRSIILIAFAVIAGLLFWKLSREGTDPLESLEPPQPLATDDSLAASVEFEDRDSTTVRVPQTSTADIVEASSGLEEVARPRPDPSVRTVIVRGEVVLIDESGLEYRGLEGRGTCMLWTGKQAKSKSLDLRSGYFEFKATNAEQLELQSVQVDGSLAVPEQENQRHDLNGEVLVLRVVRPPVIELHVLDAETGAHQSDILLRESSTYPSASLSVPDGYWSARDVGDGRSPLQLVATAFEHRRRVIRFLVRSPGHAWTPVELDMSRPGRFEVRLDVAARLAVELEGEMPRQTSFLRLYEAESGDESSLPNKRRDYPIAETMVQFKRTYAFTHIRPGTYDLRLQLGQAFADKVTLGELRAKLSAGMEQRVVLSVKPQPEFERARLHGRVRIPAEWMIEDFGVSARLNDLSLDPEKKSNYLARKKLQPTEGTADTFDCDFGDLQVGEYTLCVRTPYGATPRLDYCTDFELTNSLPASFFVDVPSPAQVSIQVLFEAGDEPANGSLHWSQLSPGESLDGQFLHVVEECDGRYEFQAPASEIRVVFLADGYRHVREKLTVLPGRNEFVLRAEAVASVRLRLLDGVLTVPWKGTSLPVLEPVRGDGQVVIRRSSANEWLLTLSEPGRYRMQGFELAGFEPVVDQELDVVRGKVVEHVIHLIRK